MWIFSCTEDACGSQMLKNYKFCTNLSIHFQTYAYRWQFAEDTRLDSSLGVLFL